MNAIIVLIPITLLIVALGVGIFFWAVSHDQFRNLDLPAELPLMEDDEMPVAARTDSGDGDGDTVPPQPTAFDDPADK